MSQGVLKACTVTLAVACALFFGAEARAYRTSSPYSADLGTAQAPVNGLKHVGYPQLSVDADALALIPEMRNHANAIAFFYDPANPHATANLLEQLTPTFKGVLLVDPIFFKSDKTPHPDAEIGRRLIEFKQAVEPYASNIAYFGFDEPLYKLQSAYCRHSLPCTNGPLHPLVNSHAVPELEKWMAFIRRTVAGPGILWIEAGPMIQDKLDLPVNADLYGFDCYSDWDNCNGVSIKQRFTTLQDKVVELNAGLGGHRRLAVIPEAQLIHDRKSSRADTPVGTAAHDAAAVALLQRYKAELYANNPLVNLVGTWIWADIDAGDGRHVIRGARSLPRTRAWLESEGRAVSGKPNRPWGQPPVVQLHASTGARTGEHLLWVWSSTGASHCTSVTEAGSYPRAPTSGFLLGMEPQPRSFTYTISCTGPYGTTYKTVAVEVSP